MKIKFLGATETVTGSRHLITTTKKRNYLLDYGLYQGMGKLTGDLNTESFVDPSSIDAVILSHAHIDHSGNLPFLIKNGFNGPIYCTPSTFKLCEILLKDSAHIQQADIDYVNRIRLREDKPLLKPLYTIKDVERCLKHFQVIPYHHKFTISDEIAFTFYNSGHILGSASIFLELTNSKKTSTLTFTGDVGRYNDLLINQPEIFPQSDFILSESTYGNKLHDDTVDMDKQLLDIIIHTCVEKKGKLIIPAFSLGRTQEIVFVLDKLKNAHLLPNIKVFVDSPMSTSTTEIIKDHLDELNPSVKEYASHQSNPFEFENLFYISDQQDSKDLNNLTEPCIIISASGMMDAGRIKHHLINTIENEKNTILIVGYCSPASLGHKIMTGETSVKIFGDLYTVRAEVKIAHSFSAHADYNELLRFVSCQDVSKTKTIFLVHGENDAKEAYKTELLKKGFKNVIIPKKLDYYDLLE
ncbi:MAG: MBL fold metallo-hydrolase [Bacteroidetes bacterium]|nr:MBL fold metallo-hydrolase [Bacteroidota bacterium]